MSEDYVTYEDPFEDYDEMTDKIKKRERKPLIERDKKEEKSPKLKKKKEKKKEKKSKGDVGVKHSINGDVVEISKEDIEIKENEEKLKTKNENNKIDKTPDYHPKLRPLVGEFPREQRGFKPKKEEPRKNIFVLAKEGIEKLIFKITGIDNLFDVEDLPDFLRDKWKFLKFFVKFSNTAIMIAMIFFAVILWIMLSIPSDLEDEWKLIFSIMYGLSIILEVCGIFSSLFFSLFFIIYIPSCAMLVIMKYVVGLYIYASVNLAVSFFIFILSMIICYFDIRLFCKKMGIIEIPLSKREKKLLEEKESLRIELSEVRTRHWREEEERLKEEARKRIVKDIENENKMKIEVEVEPMEKWDRKLKILRDMGFKYDKFNIKLLEKYHGNIERVVGEYV